MTLFTLGDGPKPFSLAPRRALKATPRWRSSASGPTKGTVEGSPFTRGVIGMLGTEGLLSKRNISAPGVDYLTTEIPGTIIVDTPNRWLGNACRGGRIRYKRTP